MNVTYTEYSQKPNITDVSYINVITGIKIVFNDYIYNNMSPLIVYPPSFLPGFFWESLFNQPSLVDGHTLLPNFNFIYKEIWTEILNNKNLYLCEFRKIYCSCRGKVILTCSYASPSCDHLVFLGICYVTRYSFIAHKNHTYRFIGVKLLQYIIKDARTIYIIFH